MNAKDFVEAQAQILRDRGWDVKVTTEIEPEGGRYRFETISFMATEPRLNLPVRISGYAHRRVAKGARWKFGSVTIFPALAKRYERKGYLKARISVDTYSHVLAQEV